MAVTGGADGVTGAPGSAVAPTLAILAGDRYRHPPIAGQVNRALLTYGGRTSLTLILEAADRAAAFDHVVVVGPPWLEEATAGASRRTPARLVEQGDALVDNLRRAFAAAGTRPHERLLLGTADIPLVTPAELAGFAASVAGSPADVCVALARPARDGPRGPLLRHYRRSMIVARGGPYLLGNLFALRGRVVEEYAALIGRARSVRRQSSAVNIVRAALGLGLAGPRAAGALATWLRLVLARALWLRRPEDARIPAVAPSLARMCTAIMALAADRVSFAFLEAGSDGACFDVDDREEYEAIAAIVGQGGCRGLDACVRGTAIPGQE